MIVTRGGIIKKTPFSEYSNIRQNGLRAVNLREDDELISVMETDGEKDIIVGTRDGCPSSSARGRAADGPCLDGVRAIKLRPGDEVVSACICERDRQVLVITEKGYGKRTNAAEYRLQTRGGIGLKSMNITEKTGKMCGLLIVDGTEDIMLINDAGVVIRMSVDEISLIGRSTQGVRVMRVDEDTKVVGVAKIVESEEDESAEPEGCGCARRGISGRIEFIIDYLPDDNKGHIRCKKCGTAYTLETSKQQLTQDPEAMLRVFSVRRRANADGKVDMPWEKA